MDKAILRQIVLELKAQGFSAATTEVRKIYEQLQAVIKAQPALASNYDQLIKKISELSAAHGEATAAINKRTESTKVVLKGLEAGFGSLDAKVRGVMQSFIGFASAGSFANAIKNSLGQLRQMNEQLIPLATSVQRYGMGINDLDQKLDGLSRKLSLTRLETMKLMEEYQKGFPTFSLKGFESLLKNIEKAVGASSSRIQEMMGSLQGLINKYPDLQQAIERANQGDTKRLKVSAERLLMAEKISLAEYKQIRTYIEGVKGMTGADSVLNRHRMREAQEQQRTFQEFSRHAERIGVLLAKSMMPAMHEIANFLKENEGSVRAFFDSIGDGVKFLVRHVNELKIALGALLGLWAAGRVYAFGRGLGAMAGVVGSAMGMRGAAAAAGGAGGGGGGMLGGLMSMLGLGGRGGAAATTFAPGVRGMLGFGATGGAIARRVATAGRFAGPGLALGLGSMAGEMGGEYLQEQGHYKSGGAAKAAGGLAGVGASAATGAMLGSMVLPGWGTAIGAAAGFLWGLKGNLKTIVDGVAEAFGYETEGLKKLKAKHQKSKEASESGYARGMDVSGLSKIDSDKKKEEALKSKLEAERNKAFSMAGYDPVKAIEMSQQQMQNAENNLKKVRAESDQRLNTKIVGQVGGVNISASSKDYEGLEKQAATVSSEISRLQEKASETEEGSAERAGVEGELKGRKEILKQISSAMEAIKKVHEEEEKNNTSLRDAADAYQVAAEANAAIEDSLQLQQTLYHKLAEYSANISSNFSSLIARANTYGDVQIQSVREAYQETARAYQDEIKMAQRLIEINAKRTTGDLTEQQKLEGDQLVRQITKGAHEDLSDLDNKTVMLGVQNLILDRQNEIAKKANEITEFYKMQKDLAAAESQIAQTRVQLMDNFAVGVGASVAMRMQGFEAIGKELNVLKQQREEQERIVAEGNGGNEAKLKLLAIENEILNKQNGQAQLVRQIRDGWVSAIGAMNTGAGRFTKIMVTGEQNLSAGLNRFNVQVSNKSGATKNAGSTQNESVGFANSTQWSAMSPGTLSPQSGPNGSIPFRTGIGADEEAMQAERLLKGGATRQLGNAMQKQSETAIAGGVAAGQAALAGAQGSGTAGLSGRTGSTVTSGKVVNQPVPGFNPNQNKPVGGNVVNGNIVPAANIPQMQGVAPFPIPLPVRIVACDVACGPGGNGNTNTYASNNVNYQNNQNNQNANESKKENEVKSFAQESINYVKANYSHFLGEGKSKDATSPKIDSAGFVNSDVEGNSNWDADIAVESDKLKPVIRKKPTYHTEQVYFDTVEPIEETSGQSMKRWVTGESAPVKKGRRSFEMQVMDAEKEDSAVEQKSSNTAKSAVSKPARTITKDAKEEELYAKLSAANRKVGKGGAAYRAAENEEFDKAYKEWNDYRGSLRKNNIYTPHRDLEKDSNKDNQANNETLVGRQIVPTSQKMVEDDDELKVALEVRRQAQSWASGKTVGNTNHQNAFNAMPLNASMRKKLAQYDDAKIKERQEKSEANRKEVQSRSGADYKVTRMFGKEARTATNAQWKESEEAVSRKLKKEGIKKYDSVEQAYLDNPKSLKPKDKERYAWLFKSKEQLAGSNWDVPKKFGYEKTDAIAAKSMSPNSAKPDAVAEKSMAPAPAQNRTESQTSTPQHTSENVVTQTSNQNTPTKRESSGQVLNVVIPSVSVSVKFENMNQLESIIGAKISKQIAGDAAVAANFGSRDRSGHLGANT